MTGVQQRRRRPCATSVSRVTRKGRARDEMSTAVRERRRPEGDDTRFLAHAQHEFAHGSRSKRESSTWFARAGGGRDETRDWEGANERADRAREKRRENARHVRERNASVHRTRRRDDGR